MQANLDDVMRRVRKLLAIAEDSRADSNEAAAAARMAESIMRKFQIEHADVIEADLKKGGADMFESAHVGGTMDPGARAQTVAAWASWLSVAVAELNDCQARITWMPELGKCIRFSGYAADVQVAKYTFEFIVHAMARASDAWRKANPWESKAASNAFRQGYISACTSSLRAALAEKSKEMQAESSSRSLVIVKAQAVAEHFGAIKYPTRKTRTSQGDAYSQGRREGSKLDVTRRGVGTNASTSPRLR